MRVLLLTTFAANRKDPLAEVIGRVHQAFLDAGLGEPQIRFNMGDAPVAGFVSSVDRVLKRHPELERFVTSADPMPGIPGARRISNGPFSAAAGESVEFSKLQTIAAGVPRSFPFHSIVFQFHSPEFGEFKAASPTGAETLPGILVTDSWWVNGRNRSVSACTLVDADPFSKKLPATPERVATVLAACGKIKKTIQAPIPGEPLTVPVPGVRMPSGHMLASVNPEAARDVHEIITGYRARMGEILERAAMPHDLPTLGPELMRESMGAVTGPKKPVLERVFKPMGYKCRSESGAFTLSRRTPGNLTSEVHLDVGTWSRNMVAIYRVWGVGFKGTVMLPPSAKAIVGAQYPIGDADRWQKIVENLGALVAELDRTLVPEIEAKVGPSPEWYQPEG